MHAPGRLVSCVLPLALFASLPLARPSGADVSATGVIVGTVVISGSAAPLAYSVVSINALQIERFSDDAGRFTLPDVPAGRVTLRTKHIGYTPVDTTIDVPAGDTVHVRIEMAKVPVQLPAVTTVAGCKAPGPPQRDADSALFVLFDQMRQNAERSRLLTQSYPFRYSVARLQTREPVDPSRKPEALSVDTIIGTSDGPWHYAPGRVVVSLGGRASFTFPELRDFADDVFIKNHCFGYGGVETLERRRVVRVDFTPADKIGDPDVSGSVYLDSATFQIRRAEISLTKLSFGLRAAMSGITVDTRYSEVAPGIPIMSAFVSVAQSSEAQRRSGWATTTTSQVVINVQWLKGRP